MSDTSKKYKISLVTELETKDVERKHADLARKVKHSTGEQVRAFDSVGAAVGKAHSTIPLLGQSVSSLSPLFTTLAGKATVVGGVLAGVATVTFGIAKAAAEAGARYHDLSIETGLYVETLSGLDLQLRQSGTSLETLSTGMFNLQKNQAAVLGGNKQLGASFAQVGLDAKATSEDALRQFVTGLNKLATEKERNAVGAQIMGRAYKDLRVFIKDANGDIDKIIEASRKAGRVMSTEAAAAADEMGDRIDELTFSLSAMSRQMISPALPAFIGALNDVTGASAGTAGGLRDIGMAIASIIDGGRIAAGVLKAIADNDIRRIPAMYDAIKKEQRARIFSDKGTMAGAMLGRSISRPKQDFDFAAGRGGKGGGAAGDRAALLQQETASIEREYRAQTEIISREQGLQLTSVRDATKRIVQAESDRYDALVEILNKRMALATKESEREAISGELRSAELEKKKNVQAATDELYRQERAALEARADALLKLGEQRNAQQIASIEAQAEMRAITYEQAEQKIERIQTEAYKRQLAVNHARQKALQILAGFKFDAAGNPIENEAAEMRLDVKAFEKLTDEAISIVAEWDGAIIASERRRAEARDKDLEGMRAWAEKVRQIRQDNLDLSFEIGDRRVDLRERLGADRGDIARERDERDAMREVSLHRQRAAQIRQERESEAEKLVGLSEARKQEVLEAYRERELLESERHALALEEIQLRPVERYIATVRKYADEVGGIVSGAFGAIFQEGQTFWGNMTSGFKRMALQIVQDLIQSRVSQAISSIFNPKASMGGVLTGGFSGGSNPAAALTGGSGGGGIMGAIRSFFGGGASASGSALSAPQSATAATAQRADWLRSVGSDWVTGGVGSVGQVANAGGRIARATSFLSNPIFGGLLAGAGMGASITGGSRTSSILGGAGGLLLSGAGLAAMSPGLFGVVPGAMSVAGSSSAAFMQGAYALMSNPITLIAGGALIAAGLIAAKNAARRRDERTRNQLGTDARSRVYEIIAAVKSDRMSPEAALQAYEQERQSYAADASKLKDSKSRSHALKWWSDVDRDVKPILMREIAQSKHRAGIATRLHATYADGGGVWSKPKDGGAAHPMFANMLGLERFGSGLIPGATFDRKDDRLIRVSKREVVLTPEHYTPIVPYLKAIGVKGFESGGMVDGATAQQTTQTFNHSPGKPSGGDRPVVIEQHLHFNVTLGEKFIAELVHQEMKSNDGKEYIARVAESRVKMSALRRK